MLIINKISEGQQLMWQQPISFIWNKKKIILQKPNKTKKNWKTLINLILHTMQKKIKRKETK